MKVAIKKTVLGGVMISVCALGLIACSGSNPMQKSDKKDVANLLVDASLFAEEKMDIPGKETMKGKVYGYCVENKVLEKTKLEVFSCSELYTAMIDFSKESKKFQGLSVKHLADRKFFESIKDEYDLKTYYTL